MRGQLPLLRLSNRFGRARFSTKDISGEISSKSALTPNFGLGRRPGPPQVPGRVSGVFCPSVCTVVRGQLCRHPHRMRSPTQTGCTTTKRSCTLTAQCFTAAVQKSMAPWTRYQACPLGVCMAETICLPTSTVINTQVFVGNLTVYGAQIL